MSGEYTRRKFLRTIGAGALGGIAAMVTGCSGSGGSGGAETPGNVRVRLAQKGTAIIDAGKGNVDYKRTLEEISGNTAVTLTQRKIETNDRPGKYETCNYALAPGQKIAENGRYPITDNSSTLKETYKGHDQYGNPIEVSAIMNVLFHGGD